MALTVGTGPFAPRPAGAFNFTSDAPEHVLYFEDSPRRVRVVVADETVADSVRVKLLHETGHMPVYYFPEDDVRHERLEPSDRTTRCPVKGDASYWTLHVAGERRDDAVWAYLDPVPEARTLAGYRAFRWDAVDEWWEEAERIDVHPRDPYHRCDVVASDRHVVVRLHGQVLADSHRPVMLFETGLPPRFYLPGDDVHHERLGPSTTVTDCPYKGTTSRYHTAVVGDHRIDDVAWVYDHPRPEVQGIDGLIAFYNEKVDLEVDGVRWDRPGPGSWNPEHVGSTAACRSEPLDVIVIELVVLDVNGTLFPLDPVEEQLTAIGLDGQLDVWFARILRDGFAAAAAGTFAAFPDLARHHLAVLLEERGADATEERLTGVLGGFQQVAAHADVAPALQRLRDQGVTVTTMTNGTVAITRDFLAREGLDALVDATYDVAMVGQWKPAAAAYQHVLREHRGDAHDAALVAVHPWDVHGAATAGLRTGWVNRTGARYPDVLARPDVTGGSMVSVVDGLLAG